MPIYDYRCTDCDNTSELLIKSSTTPVCPGCGSLNMEKLVSAPVAPGKSADIIAKGRKQAAKEGHFSNY